MHSAANILADKAMRRAGEKLAESDRDQGEGQSAPLFHVLAEFQELRAQW